MSWEREYRYPPDRLLDVADGRLSFSVLVVTVTVLGAVLDLLLFGVGASTPIPFNYPFYFDVLLLVSVVVFLRLTHRVMWNVVDELETIIRYNQDDPLSLSSAVDPESARRELENALQLAFHPGVLAAGALLGGVFVTSVMAVLGVFNAYPYLIMNFGFGAAHGVFFGPVVGGFYLIKRSYEEYIVDINMLDPDGLGGYRQIGDGIIKLATYGILVVTLDFVILSSVGFTRYTEFQVVVTAIYFTVLAVFVASTLSVTVLIRQKLLAIRDLKVEAMQGMFVAVENNYWQKLQAGDDNLPEAINLLSMYAIFHQMNNMNMWPINLYSLTRLVVSVGFSLVIYTLQFVGLPSFL